MLPSTALVLFAIYFHSPVEPATKCSHSVVFQKILGLRPTLERRVSDEKSVLPLYVASKSSEEAVSVKCARLCREDPICNGYLLVFSQNVCYGYTTNRTALGGGLIRTHYDYIDDCNHQLVPDANVAYFVKSCLDVSLKCASNKLFPIVTITGASLVGQNFIQLPKLISREECINGCLREQRFACRSARFVHSTRNNRQRLSKKSNRIQLGQCFLSKADKFTNPESFGYGWEGEEYLENQCHEMRRHEARCSFEQNRDSAFVYADDSMIVSDERSCSERCLHEDRFACLGYTYHNSTRGSPICSLHSDDLTSLGPRAVKVINGSVYARRVQCLSIDAQCQSVLIKVNFDPPRGFYGKMYLNTPQVDCSQDTSNRTARVLEIVTGNEIAESRCGIRRAFIKENMFSFLIFAYVYIQQDTAVRTQSDRILKIGCIHHSGSQNTTTLMANMPMQPTVDFIPHRQSFSFGSTELNNGTAKITKHVTVKLIDVATQTEVLEATVGQLIEMQIISVNRDYDLMPYDLMAHSGSETIRLLDEKGCPLNRRIFSGFRRQKSSTAAVTLRARFHAFLLPTSTTVNFRLTLKFCYEACPKVVCFYQ
ncbi:uncharacterized protein LOC129718343 [Wyeomyia smithii]|uniref:uncharacterized protein LOC129718343 n=1 Tax=Wyeomyia smithii TaxID=174621 RepID=UPI0024680F18|nr:uncharacterized protein LOC129718343 [Wyeomyia smithii]